MKVADSDNLWTPYQYNEPYASAWRKTQWFPFDLLAQTAAKKGIGYHIASIYSAEEDIVNGLLQNLEPFQAHSSSILLMWRNAVSEELMKKSWGILSNEFSKTLKNMGIK